MLSTTVRVCYAAEQAPQTLFEAMDELSGFGEIARIDVSLIDQTSRVLVTYFDVRCTKLALHFFGPIAESCAGAAHDFRFVHVSASLLAHTMAEYEAFHCFGEVANFKEYGDHVIVEFFDMRAAQKLVAAVPGTEPAHEPGTSPLGSRSMATDIHEAQAISQMFEQLRSLAEEASMPRSASLACTALSMVQHTQVAQTATNHGEASRVFASFSPPVIGVSTGDAAKGRGASSSYCHVNGVSATSEQCFRPLDQLAPVAPPLAQTFAPSSVQNPGRQLLKHRFQPPPGLLHPGVLDKAGAPSGEISDAFHAATPPKDDIGSQNLSDSSVVGPYCMKVPLDEFDEYEVWPQKIMSGEETRTTVMLRKVSKDCCRDSFVKLLQRCGLADRYDFLHVPFHKRRNSHCGFAFVNLVGPEDVLQIYCSLQSEAWRDLIGPPAPQLSYARLQGQQALVAHFNTSTVMLESDSTKRPMFKDSIRGPGAGWICGSVDGKDEGCGSSYEQRPLDAAGEGRGVHAQSVPDLRNTPKSRFQDGAGGASFEDQAAIVMQEKVQSLVQALGAEVQTYYGAPGPAPSPPVLFAGAGKNAKELASNRGPPAVRQVFPPHMPTASSPGVTPEKGEKQHVYPAHLFAG